MHKAYVVLAAAGTLTVAGCTSGNAVTDLAELSHIHNVVRTADTTYVGSHEGLYIENEDGSFSRVGGEFDVMALTESGGTLLASGHPGRGFDFPEPVGLIASADGGESWSARSLQGEVDFHLLEAIGETIVGVAANYGLLVSSTDGGVTWSTLDVPALTDLALNPENAREIALATEEGLQFSTDGGTTFDLIETQERIVLLDWSADGLFGATPSDLWRWSDEAEQWVHLEAGFNEIHALSASSGEISVLDGHELARISAQ